MPIKTPIKLLITLALILSALIGVFLLGYKYNDYKRDSELLVAEQVAEKVSQVFQKRESDIARAVEDKLSNLKGSERVIEKRTREIVERPVYVNQCIDEDGLQIIKELAGGTDE